MPLIDTHAHLYDPQLAAELDDVLMRAAEVGVERIVVVGTTFASSRRCQELTDRSELLVAAVGIHPTHVHEARPGDWEGIVRLSSQPKVKAIGETGLDDYWKEAPMALQEEYFSRHLELSHQTGLPFIVHTRDTGPQVLRMLRTAAQGGTLKGVMHSFTGDQAMAEACLELGLYLSFAGMVTFRKCKELQETARRVPLDRILVETDSPYLSPEPFRGRHPNEPALVAHTARFLAQLRGMDEADFATATAENARSLFNL
jgi:TatD DNase family protein